MYPDTADIDIPRFEDFDLNRDGMVTFDEWQMYLDHHRQVRDCCDYLLRVYVSWVDFFSQYVWFRLFLYLCVRVVDGGSVFCFHCVPTCAPWDCRLLVKAFRA